MPRKPGPDRTDLKLRGGIWYLHVRKNGRAKPVSTRTGDRGEAERFQSQFVAGLHAAPPNPTIGQLLDAYLADRESKVLHPDCLKIWVRHLKPHFGLLEPDHINPVLTNGYVVSRRKDGVKDGTIRNELLILRAAFRWGTQSKGWVTAIPKIEAPPAGAPRERWITRKEAKRLVAAASVPHIKLFILTALYTGARTGAILDLTWDRVDFRNKRIDFRVSGRMESKKRRSAIPIAKKLLPALTEAYNARRTDFVIEHGGKQVRRVDRGFAQTAKRALLSGVTPHTLRHTAATWMAQRGVDLYAIAGVLGQNPMTTVRVYAKHHPDYLRGAIAALDS